MTSEIRSLTKTEEGGNGCWGGNRSALRAGSAVFEYVIQLAVDVEQFLSLGQVIVWGGAEGITVSFLGTLCRALSYCIYQPDAGTPSPNSNG